MNVRLSIETATGYTVTNTICGQRNKSLIYSSICHQFIHPRTTLQSWDSTKPLLNAFTALFPICLVVKTIKTQPRQEPVAVASTASSQVVFDDDKKGVKVYIFTAKNGNCRRR